MKLKPDLKEVVKALYYCVNDIHDGDCNPDCLYYEKCAAGDPIPAVMRDALVLLSDVEKDNKAVEESCRELTQNTVPKDLFFEVLAEYESTNRGLIWSSLPEGMRESAYKALDERIEGYRKRAEVKWEDRA